MQFVSSFVTNPVERLILCHCFCFKKKPRQIFFFQTGSLPKQEAVLKATAVRSPLPAGNVVDSSLSAGGGGSSGGGGSGRGEGGWGAGDISSNLPYTALPHGASP